MAPTNFTDLPPELLDHITTYLPTAHSITNLGSTSKSLHAYVEKDAWPTFSRTRFPSLQPTSTPSHRETVRTLTSLSKAWDRRAFVTRYVEPGGDVRAYPGGQKVEKWKKPKGQQTIGYTPQIDVYEEVGTRWRDRKEVLAFSAGAEVCVRKTVREGGGRERVGWRTYRPLSAYEGRDDVTTLHLLRPDGGGEGGQGVVTGTANGDLRIIRMPDEEGEEVAITYLTTQGQPVRSSSILERPGEQSLLAANMGDSRISVYPIDTTVSKVVPTTSIDTRLPQTNGYTPTKPQRIWSTTFLSPANLAAGIGPSDEPLHIFSLTSSGLSDAPIRKFSLQNDTSSTAKLDDPPKRPTSSIYSIAPLDTNVFLSGAYDGVVRLHDLRSSRHVEQEYSDPTDDSAIYSLLPRGRECFLAGSSRHNLLKFFDLRLNAKCYSYPSIENGNGDRKDWNLFLKPTSRSSASRGGGSWTSRRSHESSVYSLASPSPAHPFVYAGVENAVLALAFSEPLDRHPDLTYFAPEPPWQQGRRGRGKRGRVSDDGVLDLAMYDQTSEMKLCSQRGLQETWQRGQEGSGGSEERRGLEGLDVRWRVGTGP